MGFGLGIYTRNSKEAADLYCKAFGLELGYHVLNDDGNYFHSELMKDGQPFVAVAAFDEENHPSGSDSSYINPVELGYTAESKEEFEHVFSLLKEEGRVIMDVCELPWSPMATTIMDKFGVRWYITLPQHRPAED